LKGALTWEAAVIASALLLAGCTTQVIEWPSGQPGWAFPQREKTIDQPGAPTSAHL